MTTEEFDILAGRIQAVADFTTYLTAELELNNCINGPRFTSAVREGALKHRHPAASETLTAAASETLTASAQKTLMDLALVLDKARNYRQKRASQ